MAIEDITEKTLKSIDIEIASKKFLNNFILNIISKKGEFNGIAKK